MKKITLLLHFLFSQYNDHGLNAIDDMCTGKQYEYLKISEVNMQFYHFIYIFLKAYSFYSISFKCYRTLYNILLSLIVKLSGWTIVLFFYVVFGSWDHNCNTTSCFFFNSTLEISFITLTNFPFLTFVPVLLSYFPLRWGF